MKQYDLKCPMCGTVNHGLYLEETDGWMICEHCHTEVRNENYRDLICLPYVNDHERDEVRNRSLIMASGWT